MPTNTIEELRRSLNTAMEELDRDFNRYYWRFSRLLRFLRVIRIPDREVHHLWLANYSILKQEVRTLPSDAERGKSSSTIDDEGAEDKRMQALKTVAECLSKACLTPDLADEWSCVNLATAFLLKGINNKDLAAAAIGLMSCDKSMSKSTYARLTEVEKEYGFHARRREASGKHLERGQLFTRLMLRSYVWDGPNRRISLRIKLLEQVGFILFPLLILVAMTVQYALMIDKAMLMVLLGAFGGSLSAIITARKSVVDAVSYRFIRTLLLLRVLLGAAGAFIVYLVLQWPGLFSKEVLDAIQTDDLLILALGIASGFSERLFVGALEKISDKISMNSEDRELDEVKGGGAQQD